MNQYADIKISVLMPVYNASLFLKEAIESVLTQTHTNFEFIILNDGSTDNSLTIIKSFTDPRIILINNPQNLGIIKTRNIGLLKATGKYIVNTDADDICLPTRFEKQVNYLEQHPNIVILATKLILINENNVEIGMWPEDNNTTSELEIAKTLPLINCIGQPTIMMRSDVVKKIKYNIKFKHNEDWGLWLHLLSLNFGIAKLPEVLLKYRQHTASTTVTANKLGVEKKILSFKFKYLIFKCKTLNFKYTDKQVLKSFIKELIRYLLMKTIPNIYGKLLVFKNLNKLKLLKQFLKVKKQLTQIQTPVNVLYFFSSFHTGGADRVHASILEAANQKNSISFITSKSDNEAFYKNFSEFSKVIEVYELLKLGYTKRWLQNKIKILCTQSPNIKAFGCNSEFYYETIPHFPSQTVIIDLIHAFVHKYETGPEKWSLPCVSKLNTRIVINNKTKNDFEKFYFENNVDLKYLANIKLISNFVEPNATLKSKDTTILKIGYVGRGSEEKRVNVIAKIAKEIVAKNKCIEFHFVGNVKNSIDENLHQYCIFHDEINDEKIIVDLYNQFHILIIASTREGFPMVIMEAMMHGVVPISTNVGGISEHVIDGKNGYLINSMQENDIITEFENKIIYLYNTESELSKLSKNAFEYANTKFNKTFFFDSYHKLLSTKTAN